MTIRKTALAVAAAALAGAGVALLAPPVRAACCYFAAKDKDINQPGQKAFIQWRPEEKLEAFTVQPKFEGNAADFGMVIPTPSRPKLDEMPRDFFKDLAIYTILMPLPQAIYTFVDPPMPMSAPAGMGGRFVGGTAMTEGAARNSVRVLEAGVVGSLDYKIILAEDASGLFDWLKQNQYAYGGDQATLDFYIQRKSYFTVMKIDPKQMKGAGDGSYTGEVTPTRFTFTTERCVYPLKITQISVKDRTDALFYVQAPQQMDLGGDLSWRPSYRSMYLTYMLGCGASRDEQAELTMHQQWLAAKQQKDPNFQTTKLEWARKLGQAEISVLDDPLARYAQMGGGNLPPNAKAVTRDEFLKDLRAKYEATPKEQRVPPDQAERELDSLSGQYPPEKGQIVRFEKPVGYYGTTYVWYPSREAPADEVKGLARLKGHLEKGRWLTKFRREIRKEEMTDDLVLVATNGAEQDYVRIMPTSPP